MLSKPTGCHPCLVKKIRVAYCEYVWRMRMVGVSPRPYREFKHDALSAL